MQTHLTLADIHLQITHDADFRITDSFQPFLTSAEETPDWKLLYHRTDALPSSTSPVIYKSDDFCVCEENGTMVFRYIDRDTGTVYAESRMDEPDKTVNITYLPSFGRFFTETGNCFFHSQWERIFAAEDRLLLHASCIETEFGGILFSGRSGIGKSTQSDLWIQNEHARLINGDRVVIGKQSPHWLAYGSPYAGSSKCHVQEYTPIRAVILLEQGKENRLSRLTERDAFRAVYKNLTVYTWDRVFVSKAVDLTLALVQDIPVYRYSCLPDFSAVETLKQELERTSAWMPDP